MYFKNIINEAIEIAKSFNYTKDQIYSSYANYQCLCNSIKEKIFDYVIFRIPPNCEEDRRNFAMNDRQENLKHLRDFEFAKKYFNFICSLWKMGFINFFKEQEDLMAMKIYLCTNRIKKVNSYGWFLDFCRWLHLK